MKKPTFAAGNVPGNPRIYHITHVDNLPGIVAEGGLLCDAAMLSRGGPPVSIGMDSIKDSRLSLPVTCHPELLVGDCVPFYFCPRSIMLYVIYRRNHPGLAYRDGQTPIVHLEADPMAVVAWATANNQRWAFSLENARASYARFRSSLDHLGDLDWVAIGSTNFAPGVASPSGRDVREGKQAEFLLEGLFPWSLVQRIGVQSMAVASLVQEAISDADHKPAVAVEPSWYY